MTPLTGGAGARLFLAQQSRNISARLQFGLIDDKHPKTPETPEPLETWMATTLYETGLRLCEKLHGAHSGAEIVAMLERVCPDYVTMNMEWAYAGITGRPGLALETRALILIAACICRGDLPAQVKAYIEAALGLGVSKTAIVETILQTLPIAGFPAVTNAFVVAKDVLV